ncbi:hypothetical protein Bca4012_093786 [Brassica carinata]
MIKVFLGHKGLNDVQNYELPRLVYVLARREPRSDHHKKVEDINLLAEVEDEPFDVTLINPDVRRRSSSKVESCRTSASDRNDADP